MSLSHLAIGKTDDLPIKHEGAVHSGKVRSVYWLSAEDSSRIIEERGYQVTPGTELGVMVISDRISAYEIIWQGEDGLQGVPGKGASLNATALHWFEEFEKADSQQAPFAMCSKLPPCATASMPACKSILTKRNNNASLPSKPEKLSTTAIAKTRPGKPRQPTAHTNGTRQSRPQIPLPAFLIPNS